MEPLSSQSDTDGRAPARVAVAVGPRGNLGVATDKPADLPGEVEYVRADLYRGAVDLLRRVLGCCGYSVPGAEFGVVLDELEGVTQTIDVYLGELK